MSNTQGASERSGRPFCVSGVIPRLAIQAGLGPPRSECGVGALMPWADRLWTVAYVSHKKETGVGTGLYEIDEDFTLTRRRESRVGTYTNRMVHFASSQLIVGPHLIDPDRNVRTVEPLANVRLCSTMRHLEDPEHMVYMLGMEGEFFEMDVHSLKVRQLADLTKELRSPRPRHIHLKAGYSALGRVLVAGNDYDEASFLGPVAGGRLGAWDGRNWRILADTPCVEGTGRGAGPRPS